MTVILITRVQAVRLSRLRLPFGLRWYLLTGLEFYPSYGDYSHTWAGDDGLIAVIGKRKQKATIAREAA